MPNCGLNPNAFWLIAIDGERVLWGTFRVMNVIRFLLISAVDNITYCYSLCPVVRVGESRYTELAGGWNKWETCFLRHLGLSPVCIQILDLGIFLACYIKKKKKNPQTTLVRHSSHAVWFTRLKCIGQWLLICSPVRAQITTARLGALSPPHKGVTHSLAITSWLCPRSKQSLVYMLSLWSSPS